MSGIVRHPFRFLFRGLRFVGFLLGASTHYFLSVWLTGRSGSRRARAEWMQRWAGVGARVFQTRFEIQGRLPSGGILACNHLGYLDILALGSLQPTVFVSKADVRHWPVLGALAAAAGTLFIKREQRSHVTEVSRQIAPVIEDKLAVMMFLEGTSTDGSHLLPFRPSLLEPVVAGQWPATPVWIGYSLDDGSVADEVAYWRDMTLLPHLLNLLTKKQLTAHIAFGEPIHTEGLNRKELARRLQSGVCGLAARFGRQITVGSPWHALPGSQRSHGVME